MPLSDFLDGLSPSTVAGIGVQAPSLFPITSDDDSDLGMSFEEEMEQGFEAFATAAKDKFIYTERTASSFNPRPPLPFQPSSAMGPTTGDTHLDNHRRDLQKAKKKKKKPMELSPPSVAGEEAKVAAILEGKDNRGANIAKENARRAKEAEQRKKAATVAEQLED